MSSLSNWSLAVASLNSSNLDFETGRLEATR